LNQYELTSLLNLFDLDQGFTSEELKVAYRELVQIWHPDRFAQNDQLQLRAQNKLKEINEANIKLQDYLATKVSPIGKKEHVYKETPYRKSSGFVKSVFHATDFSRTSEIAFAHALKFAVVSNAKLNLLHVSPEAQKNLMDEFPKIRQTLKLWNVINENRTEKDLMGSGFRCQKVIGVHDNPATSILNFLAKHPADLTVLTTEQRKGADRLLNKSVVEDVSSGSGGMSLFMPRESSGFVSAKDGSVHLKNILIPVDHKPNPQLAVNTAKKLVTSLGCEKCVFTLAFMGDAEDMPLVDVGSDNGWEWKSIIRRGNAVDMILKLADEISPDLIVMATKGHQGFLDALRGSTTEQVLRYAQSPLLAVPAFRKELS
jgi:nucleotide-binding universal stress UspA family protein